MAATKPSQVAKPKPATPPRVRTTTYEDGSISKTVNGQVRVFDPGTKMWRGIANPMKPAAGIKQARRSAKVR